MAGELEVEEPGQAGGANSGPSDPMQQLGLYDTLTGDEAATEFVAAGGFDPAPGLRDESRARRVRALLCTAPLHELHAGRAQRGGIFPDLDCYDLALGAIDFVVDKMGFDTGADPEQVVFHIFDEICGWVPDADTDEAEAAARAINEVLIRPQRGSYSDADDPTRRPFDFALLREAPAPEGIRVLATDEAINVLVGALDTDIASAVSAADAKLESLIARRRFGEAEYAAREARTRSIQYMAEVRRILADTRLDVRRAGWGEMVPDRLTEIVTHLSAQTEVERRILDAMREARDTTDRDDLADNAQRLIDVVSDCLNRHRDLHNRVLEATEAFFTEHARQAFQPRTSLRAVDIYDELFVPAIAGTVGDVAAGIEAFASASWGLADLRLADMSRTLEMLLADPKVIEGLGEELPDDELGGDNDPRRYPGEAWQATTEALDAVTVPTRLSELLTPLRAAGEDGLVAADLLSLRTLKATDPDLEELRRHTSRILAAADDGETLTDDDLAGADLLVGWLEPDIDALSEATR
jgi:hypothetical protein